MRAFARLTQSDGGEARIVSDPPLIVPIAEMLEGVDPEMIERRLRDVYADDVRSLDRDVRRLVGRYRFVDSLTRSSESGSVGTRAWILLLLGRDSRIPCSCRRRRPGLGAGALHRRGAVQAAGKARRGRAAPDAGGQRHLPGLDHGEGGGREAAGLLRAPALGRQGLGGDRADEPHDHGPLREALWVDPRPSPCALGRPHCDRRLPRQGRDLRSSHQRLRRGLRGSERPRLQGVHAGDLQEAARRSHPASISAARRSRKRRSGSDCTSSSARS